MELDEIIEYRDTIIVSPFASTAPSVEALAAEEVAPSDEDAALSGAKGLFNSPAHDVATLRSGVEVVSECGDVTAFAQTIGGCADGKTAYAHGEDVEIFWSEHNRWYSASVWLFGALGPAVAAEIVRALEVPGAALADFAALTAHVPALAQWPWSVEGAVQACLVQYHVDGELELFEVADAAEAAKVARGRKRGERRRRVVRPALSDGASAVEFK